MTRILRAAAVLALLGAGLAACDGGRNNKSVEVTLPPAPPAAAPLEDQFGVGFGAAFRASNNTDPRDPAEGDLVPVSFTTDPVPIPES
ncbi:MAG: hypothetical protein KY449_10715 [Proteobacteria bacterium]|nr:hypothetical protein [Pseudomonadota bacterium]